MKLNSGYVRWQNSAKILVLAPSPPTPVYQDLSMHHDWPVKKAIVDLPVRLKGNLKCISGKLLSLLEAQYKDFGAASQTLLTGLNYICKAGYIIR